MLHQFIHEALRGYKAPKKSCSCGCGGCDTAPKIALLETKAPISEGLRYHIDNGVSLQDNVFRIGSKKYLQLFAEARMLNEWQTISLDENSKFLIENTDIGKFGVYEGKKVPLDLPKANEEYSDENSDSLEDSIANSEFGMDYNQLGPGEKEFVRDEIDNMSMNEAKKKKKKKDPPIGKPKRGGSKAYYVYVRDPKTKKIKKVSFGSGGLRAKIKNKQARNAFAKRHNCKNKKDRTTAGYWSCNLPRYASQLGLGANMNTFW